MVRYKDQRAKLLNVSLNVPESTKQRQTEYYSAGISRVCLVMNRVLVFCSNVVPLEGVGTGGGGLRSWQII
jgi:hypothetical protein